MKKLFIVGAALIVLGVIAWFLKNPKAPERGTVSRDPYRQDTSLPSSTDQMNTNVAAIDDYLHQHPASPAAPPLRRLSAALKTRPSKQRMALANTAARSVEDGVVTSREEAMLQEAAALAERETVSEPDLQAFSERHAPAREPEPASRSTHVPTANNSAQVIESYIQKHPSGPGVAPLRRLSKAMKVRPAQTQALAETAASRLQDGSISKDDAAVLEKAAALAEKEGLSPRDMAEFSRQHMQGPGAPEKAASTPLPIRKAPAALPKYEGKQRLIYSFTGNARCSGKPCSDINIIVQVSSGKWTERREGLTGDGFYLFELPILSATGEKISWQLEAYSKDLRKAKLTGQRTTRDADRDISLTNDLVLNP